MYLIDAGVKAGAAIAGAGVQLPCSPALAFFYFCTNPLGYHPRLVRTAGNLTTLQKYKKFVADVAEKEA